MGTKEVILIEDSYTKAYGIKRLFEELPELKENYKIVHYIPSDNGKNFQEGMGKKGGYVTDYTYDVIKQIVESNKEKIFLMDVFLNLNELENNHAKIIVQLLGEYRNLKCIFHSAVSSSEITTGTGRFAKDVLKNCIQYNVLKHFLAGKLKKITEQDTKHE